MKYSVVGLCAMVGCLASSSFGQCGVFDQYVRDSADVRPENRDQFYTASRTSLIESIRNADVLSDCWRDTTRAIFSLNMAIGDRLAAKSNADELLDNARSDEERLFAAHSAITTYHAAFGNSIPDSELEICRQYATRGLENWPDLLQVSQGAQRHNVRFLVFLKHVLASTAPTREQSITALRELLAEIAPLVAQEELKIGRESTNIELEIRLMLLKNGQINDVLEELRALPDTFEGRCAPALALLKQCGCTEESSENVALESFVLNETSDLSSRLRIAQAQSVRQYAALSRVAEPSRDDSLRYINASETVRQFIAALQSQAPVSGLQAIPLATVSKIHSDALYTEIQVFKYQLKDSETAIERAILFISLFPNDSRVSEVRDDVGLH